jgi:hypothetical protein
MDAGAWRAYGRDVKSNVQVPGATDSARAVINAAVTGRFPALAMSGRLLQAPSALASIRGSRT